MGTLGGHLLPGSFFIIFGIWWSFITAIRYVQSRAKSPFRKNSQNGYRGSVTMPCICLPCGALRRAPVESWMKFTFATIGLLGEVITGFKIYHNVVNPSMDAHSTTSEHHHDHNHDHHRRDVLSSLSSSSSTPAAPIPQVMVTIYHFEHVNAQHIAMYSAFILGSIVEILLHYKYDLPARIDYALGVVAFSIEGFLFAFHLHSREALDIHVHVLLVYAIAGCVLFCALETYDPTQVLFTYGRTLFTILQGTWFWQVGFVLYPPTDSPAFQWDKNDHNQIMTITMNFCWHVLLIIIGLLIQLGIVKKIYYSSNRVAERWDELILIDDLNSEQYTTKIHNGIEAKFLSLNSDDEEAGSQDEHIEYESANLLYKPRENKTNQIKMNKIINDTDDRQKNDASSSSSTSGNYSANGSSFSTELKR